MSDVGKTTMTLVTDHGKGKSSKFSHVLDLDPIAIRDLIDCGYQFENDTQERRREDNRDD